MPDVIPVDEMQLKRWSARHVDGLVDAMHASLPELQHWFAWADPAPTIEQQAARLAGVDDHEYVLIDERAVIGSIRLNPQGDRAGIGYWLRSDRTGRGAMTAAVHAVGNEAFEHLGVVELEIQCDAANVRSAAIARRLGYTLVGEIARPIEAPGHTGVGLVWRLPASRQRS